MHDGSRLMLKKIDRDYDPTDRIAALTLLQEAHVNQLLVTGLIYLNRDQPSLQRVQDLVETPLSQLPPQTLRPSRDSLASVMAEYK
jgi:2-oxoglutarate ferredoxin oxidoreductase subunit beta